MWIASLFSISAELSLGLAEEAAEKFARALDISDPSTNPIAAYGQGTALLSLAKRDAQDGKAGSAFAYVERALKGFQDSSGTFACPQKLLGDLYSFVASLPPDVFGGTDDESSVEKQIFMVKKGEGCYRVAVDNCLGVYANKEELTILRAALISDMGANILLQAQLMAFHRCKGLSYCTSDAKDRFPDVSALYDKAAKEFRRAIDESSIYPPAWCGLGCASVATDPLLAQHAFCRSIELDSQSADAYSNLGFLYTTYNSFAASNGVLDALTQVADSPMMWINRALIFEKNAVIGIEKFENDKAKEAIIQAADAYRAALQVVKHPSALLGLALTNRLSSSVARKPSIRDSKPFQGSYACLLEYEGISGTSNAAVSLLESLWTLERTSAYAHSVDEDAIMNAKVAAEQSLEKMELLYQDYSGSSTGKHNRLDLELIRGCLKVDKDASTDEDERSTEPPMKVSLARQIVHEPSRGDLWVDMTKALSREMGASKPALESARLAASRAVDILTHQLTHPHHQVGIHSTSWEVDARSLSEALSLVHWLENLETSEDEKVDDQEDDNGNEENASFELQKALMICPGNRFAREALAANSVQ